MNYKIKLICGYRRDQEYSIDADEAHKAYYLFLHPEDRTIFKNGLAIKGNQIQEIVPDYHGTMDWNPTHVLDSDDYNELHSKGITTKLQKYLSVGKQIAEHAELSDLNVSLPQLVKTKYPQLAAPAQRRNGGAQSISKLL